MPPFGCNCSRSVIDGAFAAACAAEAADEDASPAAAAAHPPWRIGFVSPVPAGAPQAPPGVPAAIFAAVVVAVAGAAVAVVAGAVDVDAPGGGGGGGGVCRDSLVTWVISWKLPFPDAISSFVKEDATSPSL
mmetsp:Transcript_22249/g.35781  ORF Transcript_22249/g.35781 Transcript_22249/m.35781 type:complete len:132 (+) Transcript_22249:984-1379(+)